MTLDGIHFTGSTQKEERKLEIKKTWLPTLFFHLQREYNYTLEVLLLLI